MATFYRKLVKGELNPEGKMPPTCARHTKARAAFKVSSPMKADRYVCHPCGEEAMSAEKREEKPRRSGFEDVPLPQRCRHPEHEPPSHLYIPPGKQYRHICPGCGRESVLRPTHATL